MTKELDFELRTDNFLDWFTHLYRIPKYRKEIWRLGPTKEDFWQHPNLLQKAKRDLERDPDFFDNHEDFYELAMEALDNCCVNILTQDMEANSPGNDGITSIGAIGPWIYSSDPIQGLNFIHHKSECNLANFLWDPGCGFSISSDTLSTNKLKKMVENDLIKHDVTRIICIQDKPYQQKAGDMEKLETLKTIKS